MSAPYYVSPEQVMADRVEYARNGIAKGRCLCAMSIVEGIVIVAHNQSATLHKIGEIYDAIAFAGVGRYNEFDQLRIAGIQFVDMLGYNYSRRDVDARSLAISYAQRLGGSFMSEMKPLEVEILLAQVGPTIGEDRLFQILFDGTITDQSRYCALGGQPEPVLRALSESYDPELTMEAAISAMVGALGAKDAQVSEDEVEIGFLQRGIDGRSFTRIR